MPSRLFPIILIVLSFFSLMSCSSSKSAYRSSPEYYTQVKEGAGLEYQEDNRKILYSAYLSLAVKSPDTANTHLEQIARRYEGYVNQIGTYQSVIRVKSDQLDAALAEVEALGKIKSKSLTGQDVTDEYLDYQIRLENATKARDRYLELLNQATSVEEILMVEKELERLNETIELMKGRMSRIDHLDEFATITVSLSEKKKPGVLGYVALGVYHGVKWLFVKWLFVRN
jgi:hypothetical protein